MQKLVGDELVKRQMRGEKHQGLPLRREAGGGKISVRGRMAEQVANNIGRDDGIVHPRHMTLGAVGADRDW